MTNRSLAVVVVLGLSLATPSANAAVAVYGGPTYDAALNTGYQATAKTLTIGPIFTGDERAGTGVGVGEAKKLASGNDRGTRAIRWSAAGVATELDGLGTDANGYTAGRAYAINGDGTAVGYVRKYAAGADLGQRAVRWNAAGTTATELGTLQTTSTGVAFTLAYAVNGSGTAVGASQRFTDDQMDGTAAVRWNAGGTVATQLVGLPYNSTFGSGSAQAVAINSAGTAVGQSISSFNGVNGRQRAVRWDAESATAVRLGSLDPAAEDINDFSSALAISDNGTVVGYASRRLNTSFANGTYRYQQPVRWDPDGTATGLLIATANPDEFFSGQATATNASGTAVGFVIRSTSNANMITAHPSRAARWDASTTTSSPLGLLGVDNDLIESNAFAVNAQGLAAGYVQTYNAQRSAIIASSAVVWGTDGVAIDLNQLIDPASGWQLRQAYSISDTNWVAGVGSFDPDGSGPTTSYFRSFLLKLAYAGDANGDDEVDFNDFLVLQNDFGNPKPSKGFSPSDFNYDGVTNFNDFLILQNNFGTSLSGGGTAALTSEQVAAIHAFALTQAIPEPAVLAIGLSAMSLGIARPQRRRSQCR